MKKVLLTLALVAVTAASFAQGKVNMFNDTARGIVWGNVVKPSEAGLTGALINGSAGVGTTLLVDLFGGATAGTMTLQQTTTLSLTLVGQFGPRNFTSTLPGGVSSFWQVKVRENTFTTTELAQAGGGYYGSSPVFTFTPSGTIAFASIVNATASQWAPGTVAINYVPVPEPSSMALAGIGAASLLIFRRRK